jgi:hypothetical protein
MLSVVHAAPGPARAAPLSLLLGLDALFLVFTIFSDCVNLLSVVLDLIGAQSLLSAEPAELMHVLAPCCTKQKAVQNSVKATMRL